MQITTKMLGDAGEHYVLSMLSFADIPCTKMPDNWTDYDLIAQRNDGLLRISVKTRSESASFSSNSWFGVDAQAKCEWVAFVLKKNNGQIRAWVIPHDLAVELGSGSSDSKHPNLRRIQMKKLETTPLSQYESNWALKKIKP